MSEYIKLFNTREEYNEWASGHTAGLAVASYILSENGMAENAWTPFLSATADTTSFDYPATSTTLHINSNLNWNITKPDWVTVDTSGSCSADLELEVSANDETKSTRSGNIVVNYNQSQSVTIPITQLGNPSFTGQPNTEIWYTTCDGTATTPAVQYVKDANGNSLSNVSNTYIDGKGVNVFSGDIAKLDMLAYYWTGNIQTVTLPKSCTSIGMQCFMGKGNLNSITVRENFAEFKMDAFKQCSNLQSVTILNTTPPSLDSTAFRETNDTFIIYVPSSAVDTYKATGNWSNYASRIQPILE